MGEIWYFAKDRLKRTLTSARFCVLLLILIAVVWSFFNGVPSYLASHDQKLQACELFILFSNTDLSQQVLVFSALMLLADAPFLDEKTTMGMIRSNKRKWYWGQLLYCVIITVILLAAVQLMLLASTGGHVFFQNTWSEAFTNECIPVETEFFEEETAIAADWDPYPLGIKLGMDYSENFMASGSPYLVFGVAFLYAVLLILMSTAIGTLLNLTVRTGVSVAVPFLFLLLRRFPNIPLLQIISPGHLASVGFHVITPESLGYIAAYFCFFILLVAILGSRRMRGVDMQREIHQ